MAYVLGDDTVLERKRNNYVGYFFRDRDNDPSILSASVKQSATGNVETLSPTRSHPSGFQFDYYHQKQIGYLADPNNEEILSRFLFDKIFQDDPGLSTVFDDLNSRQDKCRSDLAVNRQKVVACELEVSKERSILDKLADKRGRVEFLTKKAIKELLDERTNIVKLKERLKRLRTRLDLLEDEPIVNDDEIVDLEFFKQIVLSDLDPEGTLVPAEWRTMETDSKAIIDSLSSNRANIELEVESLTKTVRQLEPSINFEEQLSAILEKIQEQASKQNIVIPKAELDKLDAIQKEIAALDIQLEQIEKKKQEKEAHLSERKRILSHYTTYLEEVKTQLVTSFEGLLQGSGSILNGTIQLEIETMLSMQSCLETIQSSIKHNPDEDLPNFPNRKALIELFTARGQNEIVSAFRKGDFDEWRDIFESCG